MKAYILVKTQIGMEAHVLRELNELQYTEEAHEVFGGYDIVVEVRGRDMEAIVEILTSKIRKISGISETQTLLVIDAEVDMTSSSLANP
ncbi:MAG: Lrp/AsnC ligand binding domain-containing protein [Candidatus Thorarchaeota archaeon]|nr:Lrp/AsnC ligand binding domain-containing protein [Candidatus Thorarchaeota archaeon]